jgi:two-component system sensor histidine kinase RegB
MWQHVPLEPHASHAAEYQRHVVGMWVTFVASTLVIAGVVARMAAELRRRQAQLARAREEALRRDQVVALGALAAGAAHELGTPLATVAVIARELERACDPKSELADEVRTLRAQADACKSIVSTMLAAAGNARAEGGDVRAADDFVREVVEHWSLLRPSAHCRLALPQHAGAPAILAEQTLRQALYSVLSNAADASPGQVEVEAGWDARDLWIEVRDRGPGLPPEAGTAFFTTKPDGRGLGLFLARSAIERLGGKLGMSNRGDGGARLRVTLPLAVLTGSTA